jgi:hypothetical protein
MPTDRSARSRGGGSNESRAPISGHRVRTSIFGRLNAARSYLPCLAESYCGPGCKSAAAVKFSLRKGIRARFACPDPSGSL